jgi:tetratricopeptide (TPR) repeat protein
VAGSRLFAAVLLGVLAALTPSARAERAPSCEQDTQCWKELSHGSKLAEAGEYAAALPSFEQAYRRVPDPRLQINIGRSLYRLGRYDEAIAAFQRYQATAPASAPAQEQEVVRRFIAEAQLAKLQSTPSTQPSPPQQTEKPVYKKWWFWTLLGVGVAGGVVAGVVVATWPQTPSEEQAERVRFGLSLTF